MTTRVEIAESRRGFVLVSVLWLGAFLIVLVAALLQQSRAMLIVARAGVEEAAADAMLTGAVETLALKYREGAAGKDGRQSRLVVAGGTVVVAVEDANGLVDFNRAPPPVIEQLADIVKARSAGQAILDRRGQPAGQPAKLFRLREEIAELSNGNPQLAAFAADYGTVFSTNGLINPMTAPVAVLAVLPGIDRATAEHAVMLRQQPKGTPQAVIELLSPAKDLLDPTPAKAVDVFFEAHVGTKNGSGLTKTLRVTIVFDGDPKVPYRIADWRPWAARPAWVRAVGGLQG